jgi:hypothetical protein
VEPAAAAEDVFRASSLHPSTVATVRGLAELNPDDYETRITAASRV